MKRNENKKSLTKKIVAGTGLALLLALVGYTGANTYAKYITTQDVPTQTATVAKWGYVVTVDAAEMFGKSYNSTGKVDAAGKAVVSAQADTNVVAPGTKGSFNFVIQGKPEVMSKITVSSVLDSEDKPVVSDITVTDGTAVYYPIKWTVDVVSTGAVFTTAKTENLTTAGMVDALLALSRAKIDANSEINVKVTVSWEWVFEDGTSTIPGYTADQLDTILGDTKAGQGNYNNKLDCTTSLSFDLAIAVEQIQA